MSVRAVLIALSFVGIMQAAQGAEKFPYRAWVESPKAEVRGGAGERFLVTGALTAGDEVEVYRHDPGGWCAIRPPEGSFSWLFGDQLKLLAEDLGEVTDEGARALVGSSSSEERSISHVALRRGERVIVLDSSAAAEGTWYKIAPPSGEFRFVHQKHLKAEAKKGKKNGRRDASDPPKENEKGNLASAARPKGPSTAEDAEDDASDAWRPARRERFEAHPVPSEGVAVPQAELPGSSHTSASEEEVPQTGWVKPGTAPRRGAAEPLRAARRAVSYVPPKEPIAAGAPHDNSAVNLDLDTIEMAVSTMVCQPRERWVFSELREKTKDALREAASPVERGRARLLLERLARFEEIQRKSLGWNELPLTVAATAPAVGSLHVPTGASAAAYNTPTASTSGVVVARVPAAAEPPQAPPSAPEDPRFDGTGRLVVLQKREEKDPQYLLVDANGVTKYFVTAAPGVNLRSYLDRTVGITGSRTQDAALGRPHIVAQRVSALPHRDPMK
jgi:hypothetical protein